MSKKPIAITTGDNHFWHTKPPIRVLEENWITSSLKPFKDIDKWKKENNCMEIPLINTGDIFDYYNPIPELINEVIDNIPQPCIGVAGNHDLQNHVYENVKRSGFQTLVLCGKVNNNKIVEYTIGDKEIVVFNANWDEDFSKYKRDENKINILNCHKYVWFDEKTRFQGVKEEPKGKVSVMEKSLSNFDFACFGDNHIPFDVKIGVCQVINVGTMLHRKSNELENKTSFVVLYDDLSFERIEFDVSEEKIFLQQKETKKIVQEFTEDKFGEALESSELHGIDFCSIVSNMEMEKKVKDKIISMFEEYHNGQ